MEDTEKEEVLVPTARESQTDLGRAAVASPHAWSPAYIPETERDETEKIADSNKYDSVGRESPSRPPPPPTLDVHPRLELHQQPGAFHVAPGDYNLVEGSRPSDDGDEGDDEEPEVRRSTILSHRAHELDDAYLVEADLVQEPTYERTAQVVSTMLVEARPLRRWNLIVVSCVCILLAVAIALGVSLGVVIPSNRSRVTETTPSQPSTTPSLAPSTQPSSRPSRAPSVAPSMQPSSMPTPTTLMTFRDSLPSFTMEQLKNDSSPQSMAWEWIATVDRPRSNLRRLTQRFALVTLYIATVGIPEWKRFAGWLNSTENECNWYGCNCSGNGTVVGLDLWSNRLNGTIPKELLLLSNLESIQMNSNNDLQGTVASEIGAMTSLRVLEIDGTSISGEVPTELGLLTQLSLLYLDSTRISGTIPTELGQLENLEELYLSGTRIVGSLPTSLGKLTKLTTLDVSYNSLTSSIPVEMGNLTKLREFNLQNNSFTGTIPSAIWRSSLDFVLLRGNSFNGSLSSAIGQAIRISFLSLEANKLAGAIPTELGLLSSLTHLYLQSNHLTGTVPTELGLLTNLNEQGLSLSTNKLTGTLPTELGKLSNVRYMEFFDNQLHGSVPSQLCALVTNSMELELDCDLVACTCGCTCRYSNESSPAPSP